MKQIPLGDFVSETSQKAAASITIFGSHGLMFGDLIGIYKTLGTSLTVSEKCSNIMLSARNGGTMVSLMGGYCIYLKGLYAYLVENEKRAESLHKSVRRRSLTKRNVSEGIILDNYSSTYNIHPLALTNSQFDSVSQPIVDSEFYPYL